MLSKKYYIKIAEILKNSQNKEQIYKRLIEYFSSENPKFNVEKFLKAIQ